MIGTDEYPGMLFPLGQADNALRLAGLSDDDLFRVELRQAINAFAELIAAATESRAARKAYEADDCIGLLHATRLADDRLDKALAAVGGEGQG